MPKPKRPPAAADSNGSLPHMVEPFTLADLREAAHDGRKLAMLTCYDFTTAKLLSSAGVRLLLVGDSAANVILGHDTTLPVPLDLMIQLTAAVKRGAPEALVFADMPFGTTGTVARGVRDAVRMVQLSGCDCVKIECTRGHLGLVQALADIGVAVFCHLGLTPQSVRLAGGYRTRGRFAQDALSIVDLATDLTNAGAAGLLLEAVPPPVAEFVVKATDVPVIGCGAGPACHAHVVVLHDLLGLTDRSPKFVPRGLADLGPPIVRAAERYAAAIGRGKYPADEHNYSMPPDELALLREAAGHVGIDLSSGGEARPSTTRNRDR